MERHWNGINHLPNTDQISCMKIVHQFLPIKARLCHRQQGQTSKWIRCDQVTETFTHVFQCQCDQNQQQHRSSLATLQTKLAKINTNNLVIQAITAFITVHHHARVPTYPPPVLQATTIQSPPDGLPTANSSRHVVNHPRLRSAELVTSPKSTPTYPTRPP